MRTSVQLTADAAPIVRLYPAGDTVDERLDTLGRALELVRD